MSLATSTVETWPMTSGCAARRPARRREPSRGRPAPPPECRVWARRRGRCPSARRRGTGWGAAGNAARVEADDVDVVAHRPPDDGVGELGEVDTRPTRSARVDDDRASRGPGARGHPEQRDGDRLARRCGVIKRHRQRGALAAGALLPAQRLGVEGGQVLGAGRHRQGRRRGDAPARRPAPRTPRSRRVPVKANPRPIARARTATTASARRTPPHVAAAGPPPAHQTRPWRQPTPRTWARRAATAPSPRGQAVERHWR